MYRTTSSDSSERASLGRERSLIEAACLIVADSVGDFRVSVHHERAMRDHRLADRSGMGIEQQRIHFRFHAHHITIVFKLDEMLTLDIAAGETNITTHDITEDRAPARRRQEDAAAGR